MTYRDRILNGVVVLDPGVRLHEGMDVRVEPVPEQGTAEKPSKPQSLQQIAELAVDAELPSDFSTQHAHYTKGLPRK